MQKLSQTEELARSLAAKAHRHTLTTEQISRCLLYTSRLHTGLTADATHLDIDTAKYIDFLKESSTIDPVSYTHLDVYKRQV